MLWVKGDGTAITLTIFAKQPLDKLGIGDDALSVAIVAVDEYHEMGGVKCHLRTLVVAGGSAYATLGIAIHRQSCNVQRSASDTLVGFSFASDAQGEGISYEMVCIETTDAITEGDGGEVYQVDEGVDLIEFLTL